MEHLIEFGVFAGKLFIVFLFILGIVMLSVGAVMKQKLKADLHVEDFNQKLSELKQTIQSVVLDKTALKKFLKDEKEKQKNEEKEAAKGRKQHLFSLKFKGDIHAHAVNEFRDEITAVISVAQPGDEVVISIESPGGTVHGYGLGAAQISRLKKAGLTVTTCVDLVAASGGYMMACTGNKILASPFAIIGSIGVIAQVPNFHRLLKKHDVDYEEITSGEFKRTVSLLGEITEKGRTKFQEQIADTHDLFKNFVKSERPQVDITKIATGEYWFGVRAKELNLVDEIMTSDEYLTHKSETARVFSIKYEAKKKIGDKLKDVLGSVADKSIDKLTEKFIETPRF